MVFKWLFGKDLPEGHIPDTAKIPTHKVRMRDGTVKVVQEGFGGKANLKRLKVKSK